MNILPYFSKSAIQEVLQRNKICILDIDSQGVAKIKNTDLEAIFVFVRPPDFETLVTHNNY